jgi:hypothetical protein
MHPQLSIALAQSRHDEFLSRAAERRRWLSRDRQPQDQAPAPSWAGLTLRLATGADRAALTRLADLDEADRPTEPVLLGVVSDRPVAALSLHDGRVIADPFVRTTELVELLRMRAGQLGLHQCS